jgi:hypothetical protein
MKLHKESMFSSQAGESLQNCNDWQDKFLTVAAGTGHGAMGAQQPQVAGVNAAGYDKFGNVSVTVVP